MSDHQATPAVNSPVEFLYRLRGASGELLYIGITRDWPTRMTQHQRDKPWWSEVVGVELVRVLGTRQQIEAIEKAVIKSEQPTYNKTHNAAPASADRLNLEHYGKPLLRYVAKDGEETEFRVGDMVHHPEHMYGYIVTACYGYDDGALVQFKHCRTLVPWQSLKWSFR